MPIWHLKASILLVELEHEVLGEAVGVAFDRSIQRASLYAVERSEIVIQHDAAPTDQENAPFSLQGKGVGIHRVVSPVS